MILAADNLTAGNPEVLDALRRLDPKPLQEIAGRCERAGARWIDLNPGYLSKRQEDRMPFLVEAVQEATSLRLILDSPNPRVLARGLSVCREVPVLNAATLEEPRLSETLAIAAAHRAPLVLLLLDGQSFAPPAVEEKLALAVEMRQQALAAGLEDKDLIFDPVLPNLSWPDGFKQAGHVVDSVRMLSTGLVFGETVRTMVGLSNLRSGLRSQYPVEIEGTCMSLLAGAGLGIILANALDPAIARAWQRINQMTSL